MKAVTFCLLCFLTMPSCKVQQLQEVDLYSQNLLAYELPVGVEIADKTLHREGNLAIVMIPVHPDIQRNPTLTFYRGTDTMRCQISYGMYRSLYFQNMPFRKGHYTIWVKMKAVPKYQAQNLKWKASSGTQLNMKRNQTSRHLKVKTFRHKKWGSTSLTFRIPLAIG